MSRLATEHRAGTVAGTTMPDGVGRDGGTRGRPRRVRAYIGLGANLGDAAATLAAGIVSMAALPGAKVVAVSRLYATDPVGVVDQPEFRNAAVALDVPAGPDPETGAIALLLALKGLERAFGRRERERWGPRELDLDLLVFGRARLAVERPPDGRSLDVPVDPGRAARLLVVPHPEAHHRLFVLAPLADLAPRLVPPGWGETVASACRRAAQESAGVRPVGTWDAGARSWRSLPIEQPESAAPVGEGQPAPR